MNFIFRKALVRRRKLTVLSIAIEQEQLRIHRDMFNLSTSTNVLYASGLATNIWS